MTETKRNKSFKEIWDDSMAKASGEFSTGEIKPIIEKYGVDEVDAACLDSLCGTIGDQLGVLADRGRAVCLVAHDVKTHSEKRYEVRTVDDWNAFMRDFGKEPDECDTLGRAYYAIRYDEDAIGKYFVTISLV